MPRPTLTVMSVGSVTKSRAWMRWEMQAYAMLRWADKLVAKGPLEGSNKNLFEQLAPCPRERLVWW